MNVRIEAAPMTMVAELVSVTVIAVNKGFSLATTLLGRVASFPRSLSMSNTSLSAVAPANDFNYFNGGEAAAA